MLVFFNGCSHTEGSPVAFYKTWSNIVLQSIKEDANFHHIHGKTGWDDEFLFRHIIGIEKYLKNDCGISVAKAGKGNDAICFETINYIEYLKQHNKKPDIACIQWSGPSRKLIQTVDDKVNFINPHWDKEYLQHLNFEPLGSSLTKTYYVILEQYFKSNNIQYVFIDYMGHEIGFNEYLSDSIDYSKVVKNDELTLIELFKKKEWVVDEWGHPNEDGYHELASRVCDILNIKPIGRKKFDYKTKEDSKKYTNHSLNKEFWITVKKIL
jgi:hypothetical protein